MILWKKKAPEDYLAPRGSLKPHAEKRVAERMGFEPMNQFNTSFSLSRRTP